MTLKEWMEENHVGPSKIAVITGKSISTVYYWTTGRFRPSFESAEKIRIFTRDRVGFRDWLIPELMEEGKLIEPMEEFDEL
jgi:hypothetical protein